MACVRGAAVRDLERLFLERWQTATGERLEPVRDEGPSPELEQTVPLAASRVALCRTLHTESGLAPEVLRLHERAILSAERLIYVETQYFTAGSIADALIERMRRSPLSIVLVMPEGADTPKERLVLGAAQERLLMSLSLEAARLGCELRLFSTTAAGPAAVRRATFIHSKVLQVDDRLLAIGSANLTNRSLMLDSELTLAFEASPSSRDGAFADSMVRVRAELLGEHAGVAPDPQFFSADGLVERLDALVASGRSRLAIRNLDQELANSSPILKLEQFFDPKKPLSELELSELIAFDRNEVVVTKGETPDKALG
jgi:phosphatidylserine/phosphatidylglycerophosphate/cardiolipin synthase-like enzyme